VSLLSSERSRAVKLTLATGKLDLAASSPDLGEARESIAVDFKGETVEIGFNAQYLVDFLGVAGTETVALSLKDGETQGLLRPVGADETDYRYIVMPMRF
jgi:DNA polymerase-3 subunit beta